MSGISASAASLTSTGASFPLAGSGAAAPHFVPTAPVVKPAADKSASAPAGVPLLDVLRGQAPLREELLAAMTRVLDSGRYVLGPEVEQLEREIAQFCGVRHAVSCASGSDALLLALMAYDIGPGDEVIVPSFTFFATASCVWRLGAMPVFVDIDPATFNLDVEKIAAAITPQTKAIIPVHLFGQCVAMDAINDLAKEEHLAVIEDAAQAIGAEYRDRRAGSLANVGCISFYPTKNLGGLGDGGMLTCDDDALAERLKLLRGHGMNPRYYHSEVGINSRLDTLQAALLLVKLPHLTAWQARRDENAQRYGELFAASGLADAIKLPAPASEGVHAWNQYTIRVAGGRRDALRAFLAERKIGSEIYYPVPLHRQKCFAALGYGEGSLPHTERAAAEVLSLPIFPELSEAERRRVVEAVSEWQATNGRGKD